MRSSPSDSVEISIPVLAGEHERTHKVKRVPPGSAPAYSSVSWSGALSLGARGTFVV